MDADGNGETVKYIKIAMIHYSGYDPYTLDSDIAILELEEALSFSEVSLHCHSGKKNFSKISYLFLVKICHDLATK